MQKPLLAGLALSLASLSCHAEIYLMARGKIEGTDYVVVDFLRDPRMASLEACEAERRAARTTGFEIFRRVYVGTHRGFSSQMQYYCVESDHQIAPLPMAGQATVSYSYFVEVRDQRLTLKRFENGGDCYNVAGQGNQNSDTRYCARSRQLVR